MESERYRESRENVEAKSVQQLVDKSRQRKTTRKLLLHGSFQRKEHLNIKQSSNFEKRSCVMKTIFEENPIIQW